MKISNTTLSFNRLLTPLEKIEARAYSTDAKKALGLENLALVTHSVSFPSVQEEDIGIGLLSLNQGAKSYIEFLYDNAIDTLSIEPLGIIKGEFYSPYDGSLLSKKPIADLKLLCTDEWANIFDINDFNEIVKNKNYEVTVPTTPECKDYKTVIFSENMVLYDYVMEAQKIALKKAYLNFLNKVENKNPTALKIEQEFNEFKNANDYYLRGDAIYTVLAQKYKTSSFKDWQNPLHQTLFDFEDTRFSNSEKLQEIIRLEEEYKSEIDFYKFCQFVVDKQQKDFVSYASKLSQIRYEKDLKTIESAYSTGQISKEKYTYLKAKIDEYRINSQGVNIIGDKQVGYSDMDIFSNPCVFTKDEFMGAPPNLLRGSAGQDWDFKFIPYEKMFNKDGSLASGGEFLKKTMKKAFKDNPGGLRIDHVIGLIDPWTYQKSANGKINSSKFSLFLLTQLKDLEKYGITSEKVSGLNDVIGAIYGENKAEFEHLKMQGGIDFVGAREVLNSKKAFIDEISNLDVLGGSRNIFNYLLDNVIPELKELGFNYETIKGVIDPLQGIFVENSLDRRFLIQAGITDFEKAKEIFLSKKDEIEKIYTNVVEKIILQSAKEALIERNIQEGIVLSEEQLNSKARSLIMCEDLGALTMPVKAVMKKYGLFGMRNAARSNPYDSTHIHREINKNERGSFWTISTHDTPPYKNIFDEFEQERKQAHIDYIADEMELDRKELSDKSNFWKFIQAKVARLFAGDKNPRTPNNVMLNWLDIFDMDEAYNTPGLYDKTKNWVLRIVGSSENFEKKYFEELLPNNRGVDIFNALGLALRVCNEDKDNDKLREELNRLSSIAKE